MSLLRKILLIAIVGLCVGNVEGSASEETGAGDPPIAAAAAASISATDTVFDLPNDTPGLMKEKQHKLVCGQSKECVHIAVPNTPAATAREVTAAMQMNGNIYFPADGHQPTTEEAGIYSCANIDAYNEKSPVTEWYMKMFGFGLHPIKAGYSFWPTTKSETSSQEAYQHLLNFTKGINLEEQCKIFSGLCKPYEVATPIIIVKAESLSFEQAFRTIAADPVGRVLLYRLLIEIRRYACTPTKRLFGTSEVANIKTEDIITRNHNRSIVIKNGDFSHSTLNRCICFNDCSELEELPELCMRQGITEVLSQLRKASKDICLFHEMLHWYQFLRDPSRYSSEHFQKGQQLTRNISQYYYETDPISTWSEGIVNTPDMRVILGIPNASIKNLSKFFPSGLHLKAPQLQYYIGDDLSENVYRISKYHLLRSSAKDIKAFQFSRISPEIISAPSLRWGHTDVTFNAIGNLNRFILAYRTALLCFYEITSCGKEYTNFEIFIDLSAKKE